CAASTVAIWGVKPVFGNVAESPLEFSLQITNVMQLRQLADSSPRLVAAVSLEGAVWWSSDAEGRVILQDDTGVAQLELDLPCRLPRQGERLSLQGACTVVKTTDAIKLASIPVVENDGIHVATEQSGRIFLKAGMHPIRVDCSIERAYMNWRLFTRGRNYQDRRFLTRRSFEPWFTL